MVQLPRTVVQTGFVVSLTASILLMLFTVAYLFFWLHSITRIQPSDSQRLIFYGDSALLSQYAHSAIAFHASGFLVGVSVALLGASLLLADIEGQIDAEGQAEGVSLKVGRMSPGAMAIVCATIILTVCIIARPQLTLPGGAAAIPPPPAGAAAN